VPELIERGHEAASLFALPAMQRDAVRVVESERCAGRSYTAKTSQTFNQDSFHLLIDRIEIAET
jgi:hypothetical protein